MEKTNIDAIFLDLDGTVINTISGETFPKGVWDMKFNFKLLDFLKEMVKRGTKVIYIVSNQGGIEKGFVDEDRFVDKIKYIISAIRDYTKVPYAGYRYCWSNDSKNVYRKPNIGMINEALRTYIISKDECIMIGDASGLPGQYSDTDKKTAKNAGIKYYDISELDKIK